MIYNLAKYIYGLFQTAGYVYLCCFFMSIFLRKRELKPIRKWVSYVGIVAIEYGISICLAEHVGIKLLCVGITICLWSYYFAYKARARNIIVVELVYQAVNIMVEYVFFVLLRNAFPQITDEMMMESTISSLVGILSRIFLFVLLLIIRKKFAAAEGQTLSELEWVRFLLFPIFTIIIIIALIMNFDVVHGKSQGKVFVCIAGGLFILNIAFFSLLLDIVSREKELSDYRVSHNMVKKQMEMYNIISEKYEAQRKIVHDFKNHMTAIKGLAKDGKIDDLEKYLFEMKEKLDKNAGIFDVNNYAVSNILNAKYAESLDKGVTMAVVVEDLSKLPLELTDTVVLFANLLDNAIEASEKSDRKIVKIKFVREERSTIISISNSYKIAPIFRNDRLVTTKGDADNHGIGVENIIDVVRRHDGEYAIRVEDLFRFVIEIPDKPVK